MAVGDVAAGEVRVVSIAWAAPHVDAAVTRCHEPVDVPSQEDAAGVGHAHPARVSGRVGVKVSDDLQPGDGAVEPHARDVGGSGRALLLVADSLLADGDVAEVAAVEDESLIGRSSSRVTGTSSAWSAAPTATGCW